MYFNHDALGLAQNSHSQRPWLQGASLSSGVSVGVFPPSQLLPSVPRPTAAETTMLPPTARAARPQDGHCGQSSSCRPRRPIGYDGLFKAYEKTDKRADGKVRDWYSCTTNYFFTDHSSYKKEGDCYNREHSVPQSWFGSGVIKSDVVHVVPTDGYVNNRRSNYPFGEVNNVTYQSNQGYSKLGSCKTAGYNGTVFEPNDEIKGDMARIYFYMVTCYESQASGWGHEVFSSSYNGFTKWTLDMLMRWSKQDPVDEREVARNNAVYEVQNNRNPFVDYPGLEDYIWGDKTEKSFSYDNYDSDVAFVARPTFDSQTNDDGTVTVSISADDAEASIHYTTDGTDPTTDSELYSGPFTLTETTTVKAIAVTSEGQSGVAQQRFTVSQGGTDTPPAGDGSFVRVSSTDQLVSGANYLLVYEAEANLGYVMNAAADKTENSEQVAIDGQTIAQAPLVFVLTQLGNGNWTINSGGTYLAHSAQKNNIETTTSGSDATAQWKVSVSGGQADIVNVKTNYAIRFNKQEGQMRFRCYAQEKQEPIALYIQTQGTEDRINELPLRGEDGGRLLPVYTIDGRMVTTTATLPRGVYIIGGKKMVVK